MNATGTRFLHDNANGTRSGEQQQRQHRESSNMKTKVSDRPREIPPGVEPGTEEWLSWAMFGRPPLSAKTVEKQILARHYRKHLYAPSLHQKVKA